MLRDEILPELIERKRGAGLPRLPRLRIWSSACSTGEETHHLTMLALLALRNAGLAFETDDGRIIPQPTWRFEVLGTDLSNQVVKTAQCAVYGKHEQGPFRYMDSAMMRFFEEQDLSLQKGEVPGLQCRKVRSFVTGHNTFRQHNLLMPLNDNLFDLILCRNAMTYFDNAGKRKVQRHLDAALVPGGTLLMGGTDPLLIDEKRYEHRLGIGGSYFVKK